MEASVFLTAHPLVLLFEEHKYYCKRILLYNSSNYIGLALNLLDLFHQKNAEEEKEWVTIPSGKSLPGAHLKGGVCSLLKSHVMKRHAEERKLLM